MSKEKQIDGMALTMCKYYEDYPSCGRCPDCWARDEAKALYDAGYRKQSEAKWVWNPNGMDWGLGAWECSACRCRNDNLPMDQNINPMQWAGSKFCPNCGVHMTI